MPNLPFAIIPATEVRTILSSVVGQEYLISVALPFHYDEHPEKTYPVIYVLDANLHFGMVVDMVRVMNYRIPFCNELPDAIIVGIGYPVIGTLTEIHNQVMHLRMRDFLPEASEWGEKFISENFPISYHVGAAGADRILHFILQELVPLIESEYRVDATDRTLLGHSWGGNFAFHTLFNQPRLFQRYVVVSPDLPFDNENKYSQEHESLPVSLYLAYGEPELDEEGLSNFNFFNRILENRRYTGFKQTQQIFPRCTHCAVVGPAYQAGLVAVFS